MDLELKPIARSSVPAALEKAEQYYLLGQAAEAESICLDILEIEPENVPALSTLLLSLTCLFAEGVPGAVKRARDLIPRFPDDYSRAYYAGIICERQAKAIYRRGGARTRYVTYEWFRDAMAHYEAAESLRAEGNDEAVLRWNACVRILMRNPQLEPGPEDHEQMLE